jgi:hypothetical protein
MGLWLAACGGGAGGGSGCGSPLPDGFPEADRIQNAGAVRVTRTGLDFLAANAPAVAGQLIQTDGGTSATGTTTFEINATEQKGQTGVTDPIPITIDYTMKICPNGPKPGANPPECEVEIDLKKSVFQFDAHTPNKLRIHGDIPVRLKNLPIHVDTSVGASIEGGVGLGTLIGSGCTGVPATTPTVDWKTFPIEMQLPLVAETLEPRTGYTKIDVDNAVIDIQLAESDVAICATCGTILDTLGVCAGIVSDTKKNAFKSFGGGALGDQLKGALKSSLCEKPNAAANPPCPKGTLIKDGVCMFASQPTVCASSVLGTMGRTDTASLLGGIGGEGSLDFLFASSGAMSPTPGAAPDDTPYPGHTTNGMTLALFGGARASVPSRCVPSFTPTIPTGIPVPDELLANTLTPWPADTKGPDLGIALAGRFLDYSLGSAYAAGALCLGVTTEQVDQLKTGVLSLFVPSLTKLTLEQKGAAMAISTRPQAPPRLELGSGQDIKTDPLLRLHLDKFAVDFHVFTLDRYLRVLTFTSDVTIPINLQTAKDPQTNPNGGILPVLGDIGIANPSISNQQLLAEDPAKLLDSMTRLMGSLVSQVGGVVSPISLTNLIAGSGIGATIPDGAIRKLQKGDDAFLGIFANLESGQAATIEAGARAKITERIVHKDAMSLSTLTRETRPMLKASFSALIDQASATAARPIEFSWAIDRGSRSAWSQERTPTIETDDLVLQGHHDLRVWARVVGQPRTEDSAPFEVPFIIDALAPEIRATEATAGHVKVEAFDFVSDESVLRGRVRLVRGSASDAFGPWVPLAELAVIDTGRATELQIEVVDEDENVGRTKLLLIRGRTDTTIGNAQAAGCGCKAAGGGATDSRAALAALALLVVVVGARFRRDRLVSTTLRQSRRRAVHAVVAMAGLAGALATLPACSCSDDPAPAKCGPDCKQECGPALPIGMIGAYTSIAKAPSGALWVAGYSDSAIVEGTTSLYGDLVVGQWDPAKSSVAWETVDGVPPRTDGTCVTNDKHGFRGGEADPGDDVGLWTSIGIGAGDQPLVAYHDATHRSLKFAYRTKAGWQNYVLLEKDRADVGRYAKVVMVENRPAVVFLVVEPGNAGKQRSRIALATTTQTFPTNGSQWSFRDVYVDEETPCWPGSCAPDESCMLTAKRCEKVLTGCTPPCTGSKACVSDAGVAVCARTNIDPAAIAVPDATGVYLSAANGPAGIGIVAYDRTHGNLLSFTPLGESYTMHILDGETGDRSNGTAQDTGDVGLGAALAIAPNGDWHVACVDGTREAVIHLIARAGTNVVARDVIDDGFGIGATPFPDGKHLVGDDAVIGVDDQGVVTICYQDATAGDLRCAVGAPGRAFDVKVVSQPGKVGGFFPKLVPAERQVANHWRALDRGAATYSGNVAIVPF